MARRRSRKTAKKLQPCELDIFIEIPDGASSGFLDIGQVLSQINRKFFRQGMQYVVQEIELLSSGTASVQVYRLPHYWPAVNSWTKGQALWKQQQDEAMEAGGLADTTARYRDFKIFMNSSHATATFAANLQSRDVITAADAVLISPTVRQDWDPSQVVVPNDGGPGITNEYTVHMMGPDAGASKGLIQAYAESRARPQQTDPNIVDVPSGGLFGEMFDVGDDSVDVITNAQDHNHQLPYLNDDDSSFEFYPGGSNAAGTAYLEGLLSVSATGDRVLGSRMQGFLANCGLLFLGMNSTVSNDLLRITLAPGDYKGVMARPMQDVN